MPVGGGVGEVVDDALRMWADSWRERVAVLGVKAIGLYGFGAWVAEKKKVFAQMQPITRRIYETLGWDVLSEEVHGFEDTQGATCHTKGEVVLNSLACVWALRAFFNLKGLAKGLEYIPVFDGEFWYGFDASGKIHHKVKL